MSEYQYYEFLALDKPLTAEEKTYVESISSRVELTSTQAVFVYNYGDFRGEPKQLLEKREWNDIIDEASQEEGKYIAQEAHWEEPYFDNYTFVEDLEKVAKEMHPLEHVEWMSALNELAPQDYKKLLSRWRVEHQRRRNLWKAMENLGLG